VKGKENNTEKDDKEQNTQKEKEQKEAMQEDRTNPTELVSSQENDDSVCSEELLSPGGTH
jgi:hypothetical protein